MNDMHDDEQRDREGRAPGGGPDAAFDEAGAEGCGGATSIAEYESEIARLTLERDDALAKYQRALADYRNFQRRADLNEQRARIQGVAGVLRDLLTALDHLDLALAQEFQGEHAESMQSGVRLIKDDLLRTLAAHGARMIEVNSGDPFEPSRHEAMMHVESNEVSPHHVVQVLSPGYEMGELTLRPAKVSIARGPMESSGGDAGHQS